ncbi:hypothetical protein [Jiulongibacter sediminis]|uniref:hypothetical protein n=1 Tax=Jiulongibacter sediminis TaxID=1605367 RepID=UPI0026ED9685|nr:hypothetical protein [Jiulongibacter sediminis]
MKKLGLFIALLLISSLAVFAQQKENKNLKIFKFDPLPLATSALSFGYETFNTDRSRSWEFHLGLRYKTDDDFYYERPLGTEELEPFADWKGAMVSVERRFYVPQFKDRGPNIFNQEFSQSGVYFAPSVRFDFNQNKYDQSRYEYQYKPEATEADYTLITDTGKVNYASIMPALNFGVQFTIFQYAYLDLHVGGGIRFQSKNILEQQKTESTYSYYNYDNAITNFVLKEGVQPTGGITFGLRL